MKGVVLILFLGMGAGFTVASCTPAIETNKPEWKTQDVGHQRLREVRLSDGTFCAVLTGSTGVALSCDWR